MLTFFNYKIVELAEEGTKADDLSRAVRKGLHKTTHLPTISPKVSSIFVRAAEFQ